MVQVIQEDDSVQIRSRFKNIVRKKLPIVAWLPNYSTGFFLQDCLAGFTVGLTEIPQGIAYASVAGLSSQYGLYSGFMGCFVYFLLGSCKDINVGPTAIMALMIQPYVSLWGPAGSTLICFLSGCIIFLLGLLHLGFIIELFSYPVIAGFTTAAALNIASSQIKGLLGIAGKSDSFLKTIIYTLKHIGETRKWDAILGFITIAFLFISKEIRRCGSLTYRTELSRARNIIKIFLFMFSLAGNALAVITGTILAYIFYENGFSPFKLTDKVEGGLPQFTLPPFGTTSNGTYTSFGEMIEEYGAVVVFCPLVAILEHIAITKAFSKKETVDASQELLALGLCNIMGSFVQSMPVTGSFTRTAVNNASGVKTTTGGIFTGIMVLLALGYLTSTFQYIPKSSLAAVILVSMYYLCDFGAFLVLWRTKRLDLIPLSATLLCCLGINLEYGILIGIATNMMFVIFTSARPKIDIEKPASAFGDVYLVRPSTSLHFTAADYTRKMILKTCRKDGSTIVIDGGCLGNIDSTVAKSFNLLKDELDLRGQKLLFLNFSQSVMDICLGINNDLKLHFRSGSLEEFTEVSGSNSSQEENSLLYTVQ